MELAADLKSKGLSLADRLEEPGGFMACMRRGGWRPYYPVQRESSIAEIMALLKRPLKISGASVERSRI